MIIAICPTHSRKEMVVNAIHSVMKQSVSPDLFLVLDNGSTDGTKDALIKISAEAGQKKFPLRIIRSEENLGASGGMRFLIERALQENPDWIWFIDDDAIAEPDALKNLIESKAFINSDAYILTSKITDGNGVWTKENHPSLFDDKNFEFNGISTTDAKEIEVHTGGYCGWFVRAVCFKEFGYPRDDLYFWFDDTEYVVRVSRKKKVYLIMDSVIRHFATSLVTHKKRWPFSAEMPEIPMHHMPRYFYWYRNYIWFAKQWLSPNQFRIFWSKQLTRALAGPVLLGQSEKAKRWKIIIEAFSDGAKEKLGKKEGMMG